MPTNSTVPFVHSTTARGAPPDHEQATDCMPHPVEDCEPDDWDAVDPEGPEFGA